MSLPLSQPCRWWKDLCDILADMMTNCLPLSQIQLVDDGADTTSPETPEPGAGKVPKRGKITITPV